MLEFQSEILEIPKIQKHKSETPHAVKISFWIVSSVTKRNNSRIWPLIHLATCKQGVSYTHRSTKCNGDTVNSTSLRMSLSIWHMVITKDNKWEVNSIHLHTKRSKKRCDSLRTSFRQSAKKSAEVHFGIQYTPKTKHGKKRMARVRILHDIDRTLWKNTSTIAAIATMLFYDYKHFLFCRIPNMTLSCGETRPHPFPQTTSQTTSSLASDCTTTSIAIVETPPSQRAQSEIFLSFCGVRSQLPVAAHNQEMTWVVKRLWSS